MTEKEKMIRGEIYNPADKEITSEQVELLQKLAYFNTLDAHHLEERNKYIKETFAEVGEHIYIELPFHANFGGKHVHIGNDFYSNFNLTLVDDGHIYIGNNVMIGPNVQIITAAHPLDPELRRQGLQYNKDVHIGNNVWIGAGVIILPGITIGDNSIIGAGSVVTKDVPNNVVAVGNPCRIIKNL